MVTLGFAVPRAMPGDPVANIVGDEAGLDAAQVARIRAELGLDLPLFRQYLLYWGALLRGDLGTSYHFRTDVASLILSRIGWTLLLVGPSVLIGAAAGAFLGARAGWRPRRTGSRLSNAAALAVSSTPPYFLALLLLYLLSFRLGLFPLKGFYSTGGLTDVLHHLALPVAVLSLFSTARNFTVMRGSMIQEKGRHYLAFARAKGLPDARVMERHAFRNASLPLVTLVAMDVGFLMGGALFVEIAFSMNGMGSLVYEAVQARDYPVLQGALMAVSFTVLAGNLLADAAYAVLDPRVRVRR